MRAPSRSLVASHRGILEELEGARWADSLGAIQSGRGTQDHPMLGVFDSAQWLRFAHIHSRHHSKIIAEILRAGT